MDIYIYINWWWLLGAVGLCATPLLFVLYSFQSMPESPKWLCDQNRLDEAMDVLQRTAAINQTTWPSHITVANMAGTYKNNSHKHRRGARELCGPVLIRRSTMLFLIWFGFGLSYYGYPSLWDTTTHCFYVCSFFYSLEFGWLTFFQTHRFL